MSILLSKYFIKQLFYFRRI